MHTNIIFKVFNELKWFALWFLARSSVLEALLKEDNRGDIFGEMTDAGIQAFVKFICSWDLEEAWKSRDVALELLKAGSKFGMEDLTDAMEQLICFMPFNWLTLKMATSLLAYLIETDDGGGRLGETRKKCLDFFKWWKMCNFFKFKIVDWKYLQILF